MLIVSNRDFDETRTDHEMFGNRFNEKGPDELRCAIATRTGHERWSLRLIEEPAEEDVAAGRAVWPSEQEFLRLKQTGKDVVCFVHGFNQDFLKNLEKAHEIESVHKVEVVVFSWPAHPWGLITKYPRAKKNARASTVALDRAFEKLAGYMKKFEDEECKTAVTLLIHSLGNYLFQHYILSPEYTGDTRLFSNVILHQADVDSRRHESWVDDVVSGGEVYVTVNDRDKVLRWSRKANLATRLGHATRNFRGHEAIYVDFTDAKGVGRTHDIFRRPKAQANRHVRRFFARAFRGRAGHMHLPYDADRNTYDVKDAA